MIIIEGLVVKKEDGLQEDLEYKRLTFVYTAALQQLEGKINTLSEEFKILHKYNPIEHISSRIKSKESITNKLIKKGLDFTYENLIKTINDIAGMRIICSFIPDIYRMVEMIENMQDVTVLKKKDSLIGLPVLFTLTGFSNIRQAYKPEVVNKIALLKITSVRDTIFTSSSVKALKKAYPNAKITYFY